ncbi:MAG TPA: NfeD family protein [Burkholderiaceae bacterium]|nr:NfeD family protein [Burkholderiaceae bacterium]
MPELSAPIAWWVAAGVAVALELTTGTFYLLMLALGLAAGALAAHAGLGFAAQLVVAAAVGGGAVAAWHVRRTKNPSAAPAQANRDVNLDIGQRVQIPAWNADGTARITYRGANWTARYAGPHAPTPGPHVIRAIEGNLLLVERA